MKKKGYSHETLSPFFKRDGRLPNMVMDGPKEQTIGLFKKKRQEANFHIKHTDTYSQWKFQADGTIRQLKRGAVSKMV